MGTVQAARPAQTLYVTIRRDELRQLKDERDQLKPVSYTHLTLPTIYSV